MSEAQLFDLGDAFEDSYCKALADTEVNPEVVTLVAELSRDIATIVENTASKSRFAADARMRAVTAVGSAHRGTYAELPVDFDVIVLTEVPQEKIDRDQVREILKDVAAEIMMNRNFRKFSERMEVSSPGTPGNLRLRSLDEDGAFTLLARFVLENSAWEGDFLDISFGALYRAVGFEIWTMRYLKGLQPEDRERLLREIRLTKRLLKNIGGLYRLREGGLGAHTVEQWVIQAATYRSSGCEVGTLDNLLQLIAGEAVSSAPGRPSAILPFREFKERFPVWHPGVREKEIVPAGLPAFNMLNYLGAGNDAATEQRWHKLVAAALEYRNRAAQRSAWSISEIAHAAQQK